MPQEPFATIESLVKLAKKEIAEVGFAEFKSSIISSKDKCIESIKKEPLKALFIKMVDIKSQNSNFLDKIKILVNNFSQYEILEIIKNLFEIKKLISET